MISIDVKEGYFSLILEEAIFYTMCFMDFPSRARKRFPTKVCTYGCGKIISIIFPLVVMW
ncbi:hypothetical protein BRC96_02750 [Halobacteriales archaeon QS_6_64_34]|nr:MAG: hypothetical protein BRC96_02750 [Halobacteriales archaeon QS_6_64_34]